MTAHVFPWPTELSEAEKVPVSPVLLYPSIDAMTKSPTATVDENVATTPVLTPVFLAVCPETSAIAALEAQAQAHNIRLRRDRLFT
jgi:hypothetical protein